MCAGASEWAWSSKRFRSINQCPTTESNFKIIFRRVKWPSALFGQYNPHPYPVPVTWWCWFRRPATLGASQPRVTNGVRLDEFSFLFISAYILCFSSVCPLWDTGYTHTRRKSVGCVCLSPPFYPHPCHIWVATPSCWEMTVLSHLWSSGHAHPGVTQNNPLSHLCVFYSFPFALILSVCLSIFYSLSL